MYLDDFSKLSLTTSIKDVKDDYYAFDDTIFYKEKGGMLSDKGKINGQEVLDLKEIDGLLYHKVATSLSNPIQMEVDFKTRHINTSVQSMLHMLDGYYEKMGLLILAIGVNPENQWYEINTKEIEDDHLSKVQDFIDKTIYEDIKTKISYMDPKDYGDENYMHLDEIRLVEFEGVNKQPCGTLHINRSLEIGSTVILDAEKTSRGTRIYFTCNFVTNDTLKKYYDLLKSLRGLVSSNLNDLYTKIESLSLTNKTLSKENSSLVNKLLEFEAEKISKSDKSIYILEGYNNGQLQSLANNLVSKYNKSSFLISKVNNICYLAIGSCENKARDIYASLGKNLVLKGGGSPRVVSVNTEANIEEIVKEIESLQ